MNNILAITHKELKSYFASPIAYVVIGLYALVYGYYFYAAVRFFERQSIQMAGLGAGAAIVGHQAQVIVGHRAGAGRVQLGVQRFAGLKQALGSGATVALELDVTNTSDRRGDEVVQVHLEDVVASVAPPVRRLVAFEGHDPCVAERFACKTAVDREPAALLVVREGMQSARGRRIGLGDLLELDTARVERHPMQIVRNGAARIAAEQVGLTLAGNLGDPNRTGTFR